MKAVEILVVLGCLTVLTTTCHFAFNRWQHPHHPTAIWSVDVDSRASVPDLLHRQRSLQETCSSHNYTWPETDMKLVAIDDLKILFCIVPKAACTNWLRVLLQLTGNPTARYLASTDRCSVHNMFRFYLNPVKIQNWTQLLLAPYKDYFKFMFVREPLQRLVSAYRDKMFRAYEYTGLRRTIVSRFRRHPTLRSLMSGDDVQFDEFIQYVLQEANRGRDMDQHWKPQFNICQPCHVKYDFIGHYEALRHDSRHVLGRISRFSNTSMNVRFPATDLDSRNRNSVDFMRKYYGNISTRNILRLARLYRKDYEAFGYRVPVEIRR